MISICITIPSKNKSVTNTYKRKDGVKRNTEKKKKIQEQNESNP